MPRLILVGMSGVRVFDRNLLDLGLTLPGFVDRSRVIAEMPHLGLLTVAAWSPPEWECVYCEVDILDDESAGRLLALQPDIVAISSLTARVNDAYTLAGRLREEGVTVVLGGLHASALPDEAAQWADAVVVGQGEAVWPRLLEDFSSGQLRTRYTAGRGDYRLADARVPRYDLLQAERYNRLPVQATRGCPLSCEFCGASHLISTFQKKSIPQLRRELSAVHAVRADAFVELADDNTFWDKRWAHNLAEVMAEFPCRWFTESDLSLADEPGLLRDLAASGCVQVLVGLESAGMAALRGLDRRGWKHEVFGRHREMVATIQEAGIAVNGCFVLGFDSDGPDCFERTMEHIDTLGLAEVQITLLTPFPGTALATRLRSEGRLLQEAYWDKCTLFDVTFRPANMSPEKLTAGFHHLMREVYRPDRAALRRRIRGECFRRGLSSQPSGSLGHRSSETLFHDLRAPSIR